MKAAWLGRCLTLFSAILAIAIASFLVDGFLPHETALSPPFTPRGGDAWIAQLPDLARFADNLKDGARSRLNLLENDIELGPPHSLHDDIGRLGAGRFSHWGSTVVFSTSDNSDPNSNGRAYRVRLESRQPVQVLLKMTVRDGLPAFIDVIILGFAAVPLLLVFAGRALRVPALACLILSAAAAGIIALLAANVIDVSTWWGVLVHLGLAAMVLVIAIPVAYIVTMLRRQQSVAGGILLAWFIVSATALSLETLARAAPARDTLAINPGNKFFWPDWVYYPLNNFGHRDRNFETPKPTYIFRILLLGDSYTEGAGLRREQTFGRLLEEHLNKDLLASRSKLEVEVFNLGHSGFNTWEEWESLGHDGAQLDPDLVILNYVVNDAETHLESTKGSLTQVSMQDVHRIFLSQVGSYAYYLGFAYGRMLKLPLSFAALTIAQHEDAVGWGALSAGLENIGRWCRSRDVPAMGLLWPVFARGVDEQIRPVFSKVADEMRRAGLSAYELEPEFTRSDRDLSSFAFSPIDWHPNARGNRIAANWLAQVINKYLPLRAAIDEARSQR